MSKQPVELRLFYSEDHLQITSVRIWSMRVLSLLILWYAYRAVTVLADNLLEQLFLGFSTLFFGAVCVWGLTFLLTDTASSNGWEEIDSDLLRSIRCSECESVVEAKHVDCPECEAQLR